MSQTQRQPETQPNVFTLTRAEADRLRDLQRAERKTKEEADRALLRVKLALMDAATAKQDFLETLADKYGFTLHTPLQFDEQRATLQTGPPVA